MKKLITILLSLILTSCVVYASEINTVYDRDTGFLKISGNLDVGKKIVTVEVTNPDITWEDFSASENTFEKFSMLSYFAQQRSDENGEYAFEYKVKKSGTYLARIYDEISDSLIFSEPVICYSKTDIDTAMKKINDATDCNQMEKAIIEGASVLGIDLSGIDNYSESRVEFIMNCLVESRKYETVASVNRSYEISCRLSDIRYADSTESAVKTVKECAEFFGLGEDAAYDVYISDTLFGPEKRLEVMEKLQKADKESFYTFESFEELFASTVILTACHNSKWSVIDTVLKTAKPIKNYDLTRFDRTKDTSDVCKYINNIEFDNLEELTEEIENYLKNGKPSSDKKPSSGGGGGGGSSFVATGPALQNTDSSEISNKKEAPFNDMSGYAWAKEAVDYLYSKGIISGKSESEFAPEDKVTREEFAKMLSLSFGLLKTSGLEFTDVNSYAWYAEYVDKVATEGLMVGLGDEKFGVGQGLKRQDIALILLRASGFEASSRKTTFTDDALIDDYAREAVSTLSAKGIINGMDDGTFAPHQTVTRAQAAKLLYEILVKGGMAK